MIFKTKLSNKIIKIILIILFLTFFTNAKEKFLIIDYNLYKVTENSKELLTSNIIDLFTLNGKTYLIKIENDNLYILSLKNYKFLPFVNNKPILKTVFKIKNINNYLGTIIKENKIIIITQKSIIYLNNNFEIENKIDLNNNICVYKSLNNIAIKNTNTYYIYEVDNIKKPIFSILTDSLIQVTQIKNNYLALTSSQIYENKHLISITYHDNQKTHTILSQISPIHYDSLFYIIPINDQSNDNKYFFLQEKEELTLFQITPNNHLKQLKKIKSYYSYYQDNYLFVISENNLTVYKLQNIEPHPLFSIPNVNYIFYYPSKLYYLCYENNIWKFKSISFYNNDIFLEDDMEIIFYNLPEEVIPYEL